MSEIERISLELMVLEDEIKVNNENARKIIAERASIKKKCESIRNRLASVEKSVSEPVSKTLLTDEYLSENFRHIETLQNELIRKQEVIDRARKIAGALLDEDSGAVYHETVRHIIEILDGNNDCIT